MSGKCSFGPLLADMLRDRIRNRIPNLSLTGPQPEEDMTAQPLWSNNTQQSTVRRASIKHAETNPASYDLEHKRNIESQRAVIPNIQARMDNLRLMQRIVRLSRSVGCVSFPTHVAVVSGAIISGILTLLVVSLVNYLSAVGSV